MAIIRTVHDKFNPYVMLNRSSLWDENIPLEASGLWARLISKPDNWSVSTTHIQRSCKIGEHKTLKLLKILQENGYAYRFQPKNGKFEPWETLVFETKKTPEEIKEIITLRGFTHAENSGLISKECNNPSSFQSEVKEAASKEPQNPADKKKKFAAASSIEEKIRKSRIPKGEMEAALTFYRENPQKFKNAQNPVGLLISIVDSGDHTKKLNDAKIRALRKEWGGKHEGSSVGGSRCCTKEGYVVTSGSRTVVYKWDSNEEFWDTNGLGYE